MDAVIEQKEVDTNSKDIWKPLAYYSKRLTQTQKQYSRYDRELLATKYYQHWMDGRNLTIFTDHKPLIYVYQQKYDKPLPRQIRQLNFISQFTTYIQLRKCLQLKELSKLLKNDALLTTTYCLNATP